MAKTWEQIQAGRIVVECYRNAEEFAPDGEAFLAALTEALDDLCEVHGQEPPVIEGLFS